MTAADDRVALQIGRAAILVARLETRVEDLERQIVALLAELAEAKGKP